jgi:hypothetical protein
MRKAETRIALSYDIALLWSQPIVASVRQWQSIISRIETGEPNKRRILQPRGTD